MYRQRLANQGDPGIFGFIGRAVKGAARGFISGGPLGALGGAASSAFGGRRSASRQATYQRALQRAPSRRMVQSRTRPGGFTGLSVGGASGFRLGVSRTQTQTQGAQIAGEITGGAGGCEAGYHRNKTSYYTKAGFVPKGSKCVKNRRMNVGNSKALRRGIRRASGFGKLAKRTKKTLGEAYRAVK